MVSVQLMYRYILFIDGSVMVEKKEIINLLEKIADLMEFNGENPFKVNAYRNGANALRRSELNLQKMISEKLLSNVKGIGKGLQSVIYEYSETGDSVTLKELMKGVPAGIDELLKIRGLGPKKIKTLYSELGVSNLGELEYACKENRLALLKGFGESTQKKITSEIEKLKVYSKYALLNIAEDYSDQVLERISRFKSISKVAVTGQLRRGMEIISELRFIVLTAAEELLCKEINEHFKCEKKDNAINIKNGFSIPVVLYPVNTEEEFTGKLFLTTGSPEFLNAIKYSESESKSFSSEQEIFQSFKIPYVIPEMREAEYFTVKNKKLLQNSDLSINMFKGLLHFHTTYSDGKNTLAEMLREAKKEGFLYASVCDHSKSAFYAKGLNEDRIIEQKQEVRSLSSQIELEVFHGIESDILQDGSLDYEDDFLSNFDFVVASIHSGFQAEQDEMTRRIIKAVENPNTDLLGHPTGRLLLSRDPYKVDMIKVIDACAANKVALEINANPHRLDLDWRMIYYAREKGCLFSINPDAHSTEDISYIKYGVIIGRKGGLQCKEVINYFEVKEFKNFLKRKINRNIN